jgi:hypothetical protein
MNKEGILSNLLGTANLNIFIDTPSIIRLVLGALGAGVVLIVIRKLLDKVF